MLLLGRKLLLLGGRRGRVVDRDERHAGVLGLLHLLRLLARGSRRGLVRDQVHVQLHGRFLHLLLLLLGPVTGRAQTFVGRIAEKLVTSLTQGWLGGRAVVLLDIHSENIYIN